MQRAISRFWRSISYQRVRQIIRTLSFAPLFLGLLILLVLALPAQMADLYLGLWQDHWAIDLARCALALCGLLVLGALLFTWHLFLARPRIEEVYGEYPDVGFYRNLARISLGAALTLSALPAAGVLIGLLRAYRLAESTCSNVDIAGQQLGPLAAQAPWFQGLALDCHGSPRLAVVKLLVIAAVVALTTVGLLVVLFRRFRQPRPYTLVSITLLLAILAVAGPAVAALAFEDRGMRAIVSLAWLAGPMLATIVLLIAAVATIMFLSWLSHRIKFPILLLLTISGVVFAAQGLWAPAPKGDQVPIASAAKARAIGAEGEAALQAEFLAWLASRDAERAKGASGQPERYPVYIFAAEGGGIYAAAAAALYLSALQDQCDVFANHVFAISGVSGGAIGATLFDTMLNGKSKAECGSSGARASVLADRAQRILLDDHLSPLLAFVLPDVARKVLPFSGKWNRATALEWSFRCAFDGSGAAKTFLPVCRAPGPGQNGGLSDQFGSFWPARGKAVPALVLNTTWVETGYRVAFAPDGFKFKPAGDGAKAVGDGTLMTFAEVTALADPQQAEAADPTTLIEAAVASARFPLIEPPWIPRFPAGPGISSMAATSTTLVQPPRSTSTGRWKSRLERTTSNCI